MEGRLIPETLSWLDPWVMNLLQNPVGVQWMHRLLGTVLAVAVIAFALLVQRSDADAVSRRLNLAFFGLILLQYLLGVLTLLYFVPISLAVAHQALAMVLFGVWVWWWHHAGEVEVVDPAPAPAAG